MGIVRRHRFVHMGVNPGTVFVLAMRTPLEKFLEGSQEVQDWYRYGAQNYVLWTDADFVELANEITAQKGLGSVLVLLTEFSPGPQKCNGMMNPEFWKWLQKPRRDLG